MTEEETKTETAKEFTIEDYNRGRIERYKERISLFERCKDNCISTVSGLESLCSRFSENQEEIRNIVEKVYHKNVYDPTTNMVTPFGKDPISLDDYIEFMKNKIDSFDKHLTTLQEELAELLQKPSIQEISDRHRIYVNGIHREIIPQLMVILLKRVADLRRNLTETTQEPESADSSSEATSSSPSPSMKLLQKIFSMLEITDCDAIDRINDVFDEKSEEEILSDYGLTIILALSNIEGYSSLEYFEYERSIKGQFSDDDWMFRMLFKSNSEYDLVSFPCLFFRAFEHPFIQCSLTFKNSWDKDELKKNLHYMNDFARRFHDINHEVCLTFDDRWSHRNALAISPYLLHVGSLSRILELKDSE